MHLYKFSLCFISTVSLFFLTSACYHGDESEDKIALNKVLLLKLDYDDHKLEEGKEYRYFTKSNTFNLMVEEAIAREEKIVSLVYSELNAVLYKGLYPFASGNTRVLLPEKFSPAADFNRTATEDFVSPFGGYRELGGTHMNDVVFGSLWSNIQNLVKVREFLHANPEQQVQVYLHKPLTGEITDENTHWVLFLKN